MACDKPLNHARKDSVGDMKCCIDVYGDDVSHFFFGCIEKICRHGMGLANIVHYPHLSSVHELASKPGQANLGHQYPCHSAQW